jgi:hypothetical protein
LQTPLRIADTWLVSGQQRLPPTNCSPNSHAAEQAAPVVGSSDCWLNNSLPANVAGQEVPAKVCT